MELARGTARPVLDSALFQIGFHCSEVGHFHPQFAGRVHDLLIEIFRLAQAAFAGGMRGIALHALVATEILFQQEGCPPDGKLDYQQTDGNLIARYWLFDMR